MNQILEYNFVKEFTQLNKGFNHVYTSDKKIVVGMRFEVIGYINGKGKLMIIHQLFEENNGVEFELEERIGIKIESLDWYISECLIKYIPENEFVNGNILIKIGMY